jgi:hypothetical protein
MMLSIRGVFTHPLLLLFGLSKMAFVASFAPPSTPPLAHTTIPPVVKLSGGHAAGGQSVGGFGR